MFWVTSVLLNTFQKRKKVRVRKMKNSIVLKTIFEICLYILIINNSIVYDNVKYTTFSSLFTQ